MRRTVRIMAAAMLATLAMTSPTMAGKPEMEKIPVDETFVDDFLSDTCGAEVSVHFYGHFIIRVFTDADGNPVREVNNYAFSNRFTSANGSVFAKDVGADRITYLDDGSLIQVIIGNVQSFSIPGFGRVYQDVGQKTIHITFDGEGNPSFEVLDDSKGQHDPDQLAPLCSVLGG